MEQTKNPMLTALLAEYQRATIDLKIVLEMLSQAEYNLVRDEKTRDPDCRSIKTVVTHILNSGYVYANYLNTVNKKEFSDYDKEVSTPQMAIPEIELMMNYTANILESIWYHPEEVITSWKFDTRWNVTYDTEQLLEHAIVHILRHRRQIEHFIHV